MGTRYLAEYVPASGGVTVAAPLGTATADALTPTITGTASSTTAVGVLAAATGAANTPTVLVTVVGTLATATGASNAPTVATVETTVVFVEQVAEFDTVNRSRSTTRPRPAFAIRGAGGSLGPSSGSGQPWRIDLHSPTTVSDAPFRSARITWSVEGPGAIEIDLARTMIDTNWTPGLHQIFVDGPVQWSGNITSLRRSGRPSAEEYAVAGLGLASILDYRLVRHDTTLNDEVAFLVEWLIDEAQTQINGDMGFSMGTVYGTTVTRLRNYCFGVVIGDAIRELASIARGFDWEIDAEGKLNIWNVTRGVDTGIDLYETDDIQDWEVELDTSELITTVSAVGDPSDPFGPRHEGVAAGFADDYGRREIAIDVDTNDLDELIDAAEAELKADGGARIQLKTMWIDDRGPWSLGDVWLQDIVRVHLDDWFGGTIRMRCVDVTVTLEPLPERYFIEHTFQALVEDITVEEEGS